MLRQADWNFRVVGGICFKVVPRQQASAKDQHRQILKCDVGPAGAPSQQIGPAVSADHAQPFPRSELAEPLRWSQFGKSLG